MDVRTCSISVPLVTLLLLIGTVANPGAEAADLKVVVKMGSEIFAPQEITIKVGDRVTWVNEDRTDHFVASSGPVGGHTTVGRDDLVINAVLHPGTSYSYLFNEPGTYQYFCAGHMQMWGTIIVQE